MALEGCIYGEAPEGNELRSLLVRALVASEDEEAAWSPVASGLSRAYVAWLHESEEEESVLMDGEPSDYTADRGPLLTGTEAEAWYSRAWCLRFAKRLKRTEEEASDAYCPAGSISVIHGLHLPRGVIRDVAWALADKAVAFTWACAEAFGG